MEARVRKETDAGNAYFTLYWSPLKKADKFEIIKAVPSVSGIFELYFMDKRNGLNLLSLGNAWYGGLRNWIRTATDAELETNPFKRKILQTYACYYRYVPSNSYTDITDILYFLAGTYFPGENKSASSGRYLSIFVQEITEEKLFWR